MNEAQALLICGCFASDLDVGFFNCGKYYLISPGANHRNDTNCPILSICDNIGGESIDPPIFEILDIAVDEGCLIIDLPDFQMRIDLDDAEAMA